LTNHNPAPVDKVFAKGLLLEYSLAMKTIILLLTFSCLLAAGCASPAQSLPVTFTGTGPMNTAPFEATTSSWKIDWSFTTDNADLPTFGVSVFPVGKNYFTDLITAYEKNSGSSIIKAGPGKYILQVYCVNVSSWSVTVSP
jgi:hypothetical protein